MNKQFLIAVLLLFLISPLIVLGQEADKPFIQSDTINVVKKTQIIGLPILFYTPETDFGIGGGAQFLFNDLKNVFNSRLSEMVVTAVYTSKNQLMIDARPKIHIYDGQFYLEGIIKYKLFPNSFWGIGSQTLDGDLEQYNMQSTEIHALLLKRIPPNLNFGFEYIFHHHKMLEYDTLGELQNQIIPGSEGAIISSLSTVFTYDSRDNTFSTVKGNYVQLNAGFSSRVMGASYSYNKYKFDIRKFIPLFSKLTLAAQYYMELNYGNVPFQSKAWLGGSDKTRGYFRGRYIDDQFYAVQAELRYRFTKRLVLVGFVSGGEVAYRITDLYDDLKYSYGGGVRFQISKKSPTLVRLDFGFGKSGNSGVYFGVNEAF